MDSIKRYISDAGVRVSVAITTGAIEEARVRHDLWPVVTAALGRTMTGALLLAGDFKNQETISMVVSGDGPIGKIHVDALGNNTIRGYVDHPHVDLPLNAANKLDVGGAVGHQGELSVTRFTQMKENYSSQCELVSGEIGQDLAYYLFMSEQVNSTIAVGVLVNTDDSVQVAGGFLVQALPGADDEALKKIEENISSLGALTSYLSEHPEGDGLIEKIMAGVEYKEVFASPVRFGCTCDEERFLDVLSRLSKDDKEAILEQDETELVCHYCNTAYRYSKERIAKAFAKAEQEQNK